MGSPSTPRDSPETAIPPSLSPPLRRRRKKKTTTATMPMPIRINRNGVFLIVSITLVYIDFFELYIIDISTDMERGEGLVLLVLQVEKDGTWRPTLIRHAHKVTCPSTNISCILRARNVLMLFKSRRE